MEFLFAFGERKVKSGFLFTGLGIALLLLGIMEPAAAHHAMGGRTPSNLVEGFLSGLAHPLIGIDHFALVVAVGLFAALKASRGLGIPLAFVLSTLGGTILHLLGLDLPFPEAGIALSVLGFGLLLGREHSPHLLWLVSLAGIAGVFHGYAYGEAIVGAQMTPLGAYLAGFTLIQLLVALIAFSVGKLALNNAPQSPALAVRFAGFTIAGIGAAFLSSVLL